MKSINPALCLPERQTLSAIRFLHAARDFIKGRSI